MTEIGFNGMWLPQDQDPRMGDTPSRGERAVLVEYLEHYRATLELKCEGLTPEQLGTRSVPPSRMSLLGMVRHFARVEQSWFRRIIEGQHDLERHFQEEDGGFELGEPTQELVDASFALLREEVAHSREVLERTDLDTIVDVHGDQVEVRDVVVHMIEEYARHCGHADLLRECLDGRTGQ
jgi:uncharacterized damage-inducible protein DinB